MEITLDEGAFGTFILRNESGDELLIQSDWDYPGVASSFGWVPCACGATDGTVECPHRLVDDMIAEARQFLDDNFGKSVEDPGYFEG